MLAHRFRVARHRASCFARFHAHSRRCISAEPALLVHPEVQHALRNGLPVVALESTIITHGMPYPDNLNTALSVEALVREQGCVPATIAILQGQIHVGLRAEEVEQLARLERHQVVKCSRRDIASIVGLRQNGATTVSGTMCIAHRAGIPVFVTGGIGGVHRGAESSMDISADLTELGRTPVAVVCAGVKSILDIGRTLEYLETQGVTVATLAETNDFPAFYAPKSGFRSPTHIRTADEAARMIHASHQLELQSGMVFAVPIPQTDAQDAEEIERVIEQALRESVERGIGGKEATPFLLARIADLTGARSLQANIALIRNNAVVGSHIARELAQLQRSRTSVIATPPGTESSAPVFIGAACMDIISKLKKDSSGSGEWKHLMQTSNPSSIQTTAGGVARNSMECCQRVLTGDDTPIDERGETLRNKQPLRDDFRYPVLIAPLGRNGEPHSEKLRQLTKNMGSRMDGFMEPNENASAQSITAPVYNAILDGHGKLMVGAASMDIFEPSSRVVTSAALEEKYARHVTPTTPIVCLDGNLVAPLQHQVIKHCERAQVPLWFEPTSVPKCTRLLDQMRPIVGHVVNPSVSYVSPNVDELLAMSNYLRSQKKSASLTTVSGRALLEVMSTDGRLLKTCYASEANIQSLPDLLPHLRTVLEHVPNVFLKLGKEGILLAQNTILSESETWAAFDTTTGSPTAKEGVAFLQHFQPDSSIDRRIVNVNGAGDSFVGATIASLTQQVVECSRAIRNDSMVRKHALLFNTLHEEPTRERMAKAVLLGRQAAEWSLLSSFPVNPDVGRLSLKA